MLSCPKKRTVTKRMTTENILIRVLGSCEATADASVACTNETTALRRNVASGVAGSIGIQTKSVHDLKENGARARAPDQEQEKPQEKGIIEVAGEPQVNRKHTDGLSIERAYINTVPSPSRINTPIVLVV